MEIRLSSVLLAAALLSGCGWFHRGEKGPAPVVAEEPQGEPTIIEPQVNRREVKTPKIKAKDFEIGGYFGALSIQDFGTNPIYGVRAAYHVSEDIFLEGFLAARKRGRPAWRTSSPISRSSTTLGDASRITTWTWATTYYRRDLSRAGTCFQFGAVCDGRHGRREIRRQGPVRTELRIGRALLITDWLALHLDVRDHVFETDLTGRTKNVHNLEATLGLTAFY